MAKGKAPGLLSALGSSWPCQRRQQRPPPPGASDTEEWPGRSGFSPFLRTGSSEQATENQLRVSIDQYNRRLAAGASPCSVAGWLCGPRQAPSSLGPPLSQMDMIRPCVRLSTPGLWTGAWWRWSETEVGTSQVLGAGTEPELMGGHLGSPERWLLAPGLCL